MNTAAKRANAAWIGIPLPATVLPSGTLSSLERAAVADTYGANSFAPPVFGTASNLLLLGVG